MRIAINLLPFGRDLAGTGRYAKNILRSLKEIDHENEYFLILRHCSTHNFSESRNFRKIEIPLVPNRVVRIIFEQLCLPLLVRYLHCGILFTPSVAIPFWGKFRKITTIHDAAPFVFLTKYRWLRSVYVKFITRISAKLSDVIVTVSHDAKRAIFSYCKIPIDNIVVIHNGVDSIFLSDFKMINSSLKISGRYILSVGTIEPCKNFTTLLEAYNILRNEGFPYKLVIVGGKAWGYEEFLKRLKGLRLEKEVIVPGFVDDNELLALYDGAELFICVSLYEGFGIPVIEAMARGVPVIVSNLSCFPEIVRDVAILVDPLNACEIASKIQEVIGNEGLRKRMAIAGRKHTKAFTWNKSAEKLLEVFNREKNG